MSIEEPTSSKHNHSVNDIKVLLPTHRKMSIVETPSMSTPNELRPVLTTLHLCSDSIKAEKKVFSSLTEPPPDSNPAALHPKNKWMFDMEESLLKLATLEQVTAGVFYCMTFMGDNFIYCRYIESGVYLTMCWYCSLYW